MCSAGGCERAVVARGLCSMHWQRWRKTAVIIPRVLNAERTCEVVGCEDPVFTRTWCNSHYYRQRRHGHPLAGGASKRQPCSEPGCDAPGPMRQGRCARHYYEWRKTRRAPCSLPGCEIPANSKGLCARHYQRLRKYGHPLAGPAFRRERGKGLPRWAYNQRRREQELAADPNLLDYVAILQRDPCSYCGAPCEHIDHIEPVNAGGALVVENVTASCMRCNVRKNQTPLLLWLALR